MRKTKKLIYLIGFALIAILFSGCPLLEKFMEAYGSKPLPDMILETIFIFEPELSITQETALHEMKTGEYLDITLIIQKNSEENCRYHVILKEASDSENEDTDKYELITSEGLSVSVMEGTEESHGIYNLNEVDSENMECKLRLTAMKVGKYKIQVQAESEKFKDDEYTKYNVSVPRYFTIIVTE